MAPLSKEQYIRSLTAPDNEECPICQDLFDREAHLAVRLGCGHYFCKACLISTAEKSPSPDTCPKCRAPVFSENGEERHRAISQIPQPFPRGDFPASSATIRNLPDYYIPLNRLSTATLYQQHWMANFVEISIPDIGNVVSRIWDIVRPEALAWQSIAQQSNTTLNTFNYVVDGVIMNIIHSFDPNVGENAHYSFVRGYLSHAMIHQHDFRHAEFASEPYRNLVGLMLTYPGMRFTRTLRPESAALWWGFNLVCSRHVDLGTLTYQGPPLEHWEQLLALQFLLMIENSCLIDAHEVERDSSPVEGLRTYWNWQHNFWDLCENTMNFRLASRKISIKSELERVQDASGTPNQPVFIGAQEELDQVEQLWIKASASP